MCIKQKTNLKNKFKNVLENSKNHFLHIYQDLNFDINVYFDGKSAPNGMLVGIFVVGHKSIKYTQTMKKNG